MKTVDIEDRDHLLAYLRASNRIEITETPRIEVLAGGVSCRTVLVSRESGDWVLKQALERLRVPETWEADPARSEREAEAMKVLNEILDTGRVPTLVFSDASQHLLAMTAVQQPFENWKVRLLRGEVDEDTVVDFGQLLAAIHVRAAKRRDTLEPLFRDRSLFQALRIDPYYLYIAKRHDAARKFVLQLVTDTQSTHITLVHGDFSPKNVLIGSSGCVLVDHEVAHWGDPAFDVGFAAAHFLSKANHMQLCRDLFLEAAGTFWATYAASAAAAPWFRGVEERSVRHTTACLLARVDGKSPVEYLDAGGRDRQRAAALALMQDPPQHFNALVSTFSAELGP